MSEKEKEAAPPATEADTQAVPVIKPRKKFIPKKVTHKAGQALERRSRHILLSSQQAAELVRQTILDFQKELAEKPMDDLDKEFNDQQKVESFFERLAKKYSACPTRLLGGDLKWIHKDMEILDQTVLNRSLIDVIEKTDKHNIPEPLQTPKGFHIVLVCETRPMKKKETKSMLERTVVDDIHQDAVRGEHPKSWGSDVAPN
ncbi:MAG: peptidylprolyl isomerase [Nitrospinota bacterium]|nr:peptidylprolyl isomerase [Nitrospinota bacterium]